MPDSLRPHRRQPIRLPRPWDSPGKNTGVGCHFLLHCRKVKTESEVAQSCPTLSDPMDRSLPHFIYISNQRLLRLRHWQARTLGIPSGTSHKEPAYQCRKYKQCGFNPWVGKIPWKRAWQPTPVFLPQDSHGQRSLAGYGPWSCKSPQTHDLVTKPELP